MNLTSNDLPATATRRRWSYAWVGYQTPTDGHDGTLTVVEETGVRVCRTVTDTYGVSETYPVGFNGRAFLCCKTGHAGDLDTAKGRASLARVGDVYECHIHADGQRRCTCPAGAAGLLCGHAIALADLIDTGDLPDPWAAMPGTPEWDDDAMDDHAAWADAEVAAGRMDAAAVYG